MRVQRAWLGGVEYLAPDEGAAHLLSVDFETMVSFPVNKRDTAFLCATARNPDGQPIISALSTDGGAIPRNFLISHGLSLVQFDALSRADFVLKAAWTPARMLGLLDKGHLAPGADADLVVIDEEKRSPLLTVAGGRIVMVAGMVVGRGGKLITTRYGVDTFTERGVPFEVAVLEKSLFYNAPTGMPRLTG
jgi:hypothetical protein